VKELRVQIKVSNNLLRSRRIGLGLSAKEAAAKAGVGYGTYVGLENLHQPARVTAHRCRALGCETLANGTTQYRCRSHADDAFALEYPLKQRWASAVVRLARFYECEPEELFPESVRRVTQPVVETEADVADLECMASLTGSMLPPDLAAIAALPPDRHLEDDDRNHVVGEVIESILSPRQRRFIRRRFGFGGGEAMTLEEVAIAEGGSKERTRQILEKAIRKLRHGATARRLAEVDSEQTVDRIGDRIPAPHNHQVDLEEVACDRGDWWGPCVHCGQRINLDPAAVAQERAAQAQKAARE